MEFEEHVSGRLTVTAGGYRLVLKTTGYGEASVVEITLRELTLPSTGLVSANTRIPMAHFHRLFDDQNYSGFRMPSQILRLPIADAAGVESSTLVVERMIGGTDDEYRFWDMSFGRSSSVVVSGSKLAKLRTPLDKEVLRTAYHRMDRRVVGTFLVAASYLFAVFYSATHDSAQLFLSALFGAVGLWWVWRHSVRSYWLPGLIVTSVFALVAWFAQCR